MMNAHYSPPDRKRLINFTKHVGRGINRFGMIKNGDKILIGVSGGKDSLALSFALAERRKWVPLNYSLVAVQIEWKEFPVEESEKRELDAFFKSVEIPLKRIKASIIPDSFNRNFNCYLCSRNRKRILFDFAESIGINMIALGHHLDDIVETTLINLFFRGEFSTMMPIQEFFGGRIKIIRPMCEVKEKEISRVAQILELPVIPIRCPKKGVSDRLFVKEIVEQVMKRNKFVKENIYKAHWNIKKEYLPGLLEGWIDR